MKKIVLALLFLPVLAFGQQEATFTVVAVEDEKENNDRYYTGLGIQLLEVDESYSGKFPVGMFQFDNSDGSYTNSIFLTRVPPDTPASRGGLRVGDRILFLDGNNVQERGLRWLIDYIKNTNLDVELVIERYDSENEVWNRPPLLRLKTEKIDRVAFVHMDVVLSASSCNGEGCVLFESSVREDMETGDFVYTYKISSTREGDTYVSWEILSRAILERYFAALTVFSVSPTETVEFELRSKSIPTETTGMGMILTHADRGDTLLQIHRVEYKSGGSFLMTSFRIGSSGFVPEPDQR